ncbi:glycosyltransferase family 4 protein [Listeria valentina]|uniref:glycosyltransferase family 4 protein n=1 Tax=Listeria valentina TaxID=2705293 RepID=UPI001430DF66|nr:glycosyltransferase family 4 protein [Listeria valentina]
MKKKVTMFVWNEFTNDARVLRECTALHEAGYRVFLIALRGNQEKLEKPLDQFYVRRVRFNWPKPKRFWSKFLIIILWGLLTWFSPLLGMILVAMWFLIYQTKCGSFLKKVIQIVEMIYWGIRTQTDVYHANDLNTLFQAVVCAKWLKNKPLVFDSHEVNLSRTGYNAAYYGIAEKWLLHFVDRCIHENHTRAKFIRRVYGFYPAVVYNYPFFSDETEVPYNLHEKLNIANDEPILLYQGGLQSGRGLEKLIDATPLIKRGVVVFLGDGKLRAELIRQTERLRLQHRIKFLPKVPVGELPLYTRNAYLGIQLLNDTCFNHYSAASNKLFEYMMAGVPVVACSFPEIRKVVTKEKIGVIVQSNDVNSIARGINEMLDHPEMRDEMSQNARKARLRYSWEREQEGFLRIYQELVKE